MSLASTQALDQDWDYLFKVLLIGDSGVGKSCLLLKYTEDYFSDRFISTIGVDFKIKTIQIPGCDKTAKLQLWDTAGQERFRTITNAYYRGCHAAVIVFDCANRVTFDHVRSWLQEVDRYALPGVVRVLVATKTDLNQHRVVGAEEAKAFADAQQMKYVEASARSGVGINEIFRICAKEVYDRALSGAMQTQRKEAAIRGPKVDFSRARVVNERMVNCCTIA